MQQAATTVRRPEIRTQRKTERTAPSFFDMLSAEELKITESVPLGGREALEHEMKILKFREHKILAKIAEYESQPEDALFVSSLLDMRTPGGRGKDTKRRCQPNHGYVQQGQRL